MPLFHIVCAPLLRLIGERPDALIYMRMAMLPLYGGTIALTFRIAASCYPRRTAIWSSIVASLVPGYLLCSTEFRTDDLWTLLWLFSVAILVTAPLTPWRAAASGRGFLLPAGAIFPAGAFFCLGPGGGRNRGPPSPPRATTPRAPLPPRGGPRRYATIAAVEIVLVFGLGELWRDRTPPALAL